MEWLDPVTWTNDQKVAAVFLGVGGLVCLMLAGLIWSMKR